MIPQCTFYVQADKKIGIGHLMRSKSIIESLRGNNVRTRLMLDRNDFIKPILKELDITSSEVKEGTGALIIDAVNLEEISESILLSYNPRILISPIFDRFDLVTHYFTRSIDSQIKTNIPPNVKTVIDPLFFFSSIENFNKRRLNFEELNIGVCISGSNDYVNLDKLIRVISRLKSLKSLKVIGQKLSLDSLKCGVDLKFSNFEKTPWNYFKDINVFIGGEGIMLAEALYQNIPSISMCRSEFKGKNRKLFSSDLINTIILERNWKKNLLLALRNLELLKNQHEKLRDIKISNSTLTLAENIKKTILN